jgi:hypothetical protein
MSEKTLTWPDYVEHLKAIGFTVLDYRDLGKGFLITQPYTDVLLGWNIHTKAFEINTTELRGSYLSPDQALEIIERLTTVTEIATNLNYWIKNKGMVTL